MTNKIIFFALLFFLSTNASAQSPWVNKQGSFYGQFSFTSLTYANIVNDELNTIVPADSKTRDLTASLYADYSLSDRLAVLVSLPYKTVQYNNESLSGLGDPTLKFKYQFSENIPLSGYVGYAAPLSKREGALRTGYNQHAAELGLSIGVGKEKYFTYAGLGYRYRDNIPNQVLIEFEYGRRFVVAQKTLYVMFHTDGMLNTSDIEDTASADANLFHNDGEFMSLAFKFSYNVSGGFWINAAAHSAFFVRNFGAAPTLTVGLAYKLED